MRNVLVSVSHLCQPSVYAVSHMFVAQSAGLYTDQRIPAPFVRRPAGKRVLSQAYCAMQLSLF